MANGVAHQSRAATGERVYTAGSPQALDWTELPMLPAPPTHQGISNTTTSYLDGGSGFFSKIQSITNLASELAALEGKVTGSNPVGCTNPPLFSELSSPLSG